MATEFKVSTAKLTEEAARQRKSLNEAQKLLGKTTSDINYLEHSWSGEAHSAFTSTATQYINKMKNFISLTEQYQRALDAAVSLYDGAEQAAKRIASQKGQ